MGTSFVYKTCPKVYYQAKTKTNVIKEVVKGKRYCHCIKQGVSIFCQKILKENPKKSCEDKSFPLPLKTN